MTFPPSDDTSRLLMPPTDRLIRVALKPRRGAIDREVPGGRRLCTVQRAAGRFMMPARHLLPMSRPSLSASTVATGPKRSPPPEADFGHYALPPVAVIAPMMSRGFIATMPVTMMAILAARRRPFDDGEMSQFPPLGHERRGAYVA